MLCSESYSLPFFFCRNLKMMLPIGKTEAAAAVTTMITTSVTTTRMLPLAPGTPTALDTEPASTMMTTSYQL